MSRKQAHSKTTRLFLPKCRLLGVVKNNKILSLLHALKPNLCSLKQIKRERKIYWRVLDMRDHYDFSDSAKNPYAKKTQKRQVTIPALMRIPC